MDDLLKLAAFSFFMLLGSYLAGSVPLAFSFSEHRLRLVTSFGAGLLVGAALIVIIPEGVELLIEGDSIAPPVHNGDVQTTNSGGEANPVSPALPASALQSHDHAHQLSRLNWMGLALVLGFVFMLLVDQVGKHSHTSSTSMADEDLIIVRTKRKNTATIGLLVHAAVDGVALGAAASASKTDVEVVVFVAIMLHKAPAAFGLTSFLMHEGFDRVSARLHLLAFSLAAPIMAFVSYFGLGNFLRGVDLPVTGLAMLFSAGTFLYVATVHVLTEIVEGRSHSTLPGPPFKSTTDQHNGGEQDLGLTKAEVLCIVAGSLLPLVFNIVHAH